VEYDGEGGEYDGGGVGYAGDEAECDGGGAHDDPGADVIWAVVLAAGASSRMGQPKALLRVPDGRTFVAAIADAARGGGCGGVVAVVGPPHGDAVRRALPPAVSAAVNPRPERGMLSSVQAGLAALPAAATAALIWPVDVPFVEAATVRRILSAAPGKIIVPMHNERGKPAGGHPLRVPRAVFGAIMSLDLDRGLKGLLTARPELVERVTVADRAVLVDVDTPEDYARVRP
jgi:molybdenum cofactor cytidylyltransferase